MTLKRIIEILDEFYQQNEDLLDLRIQKDKWEINDDIIFTTNDKVKGKVEFSTKKVLYSKLSHKFALMGSHSYNGWLMKNLIPNFETHFSHLYENQPKEKYGDGEYWFPNCDNGKKIHDNISSLTKSFIAEQKRLLEDEERLLAERQKEEQKKNKEKLVKSQNEIIRELDKDGNGEIDTIEVKDDFDKLVKKHQSKVVEADRSYIQHFVKISNYQKQKRKNIQSIFESISETKDQYELSLQVELLKEQIHSFELLLFHSLNMVTSLVEDDMFTFYEIYESFDKLEIFNSNHENEVSKRLINIEGGIYDLMSSIRMMEENIIGELGNLSYITQESYNQLSNNVTSELKSIGSAISANSLLTGINAYQTYKLRSGK